MKILKINVIINYKLVKEGSLNKMVEVKRNEVYTDSLVYAEKFGINHRDLLEKIRKLTAEVSAPEKYFKESEFTNKQGRDYFK